MSDEHGDPWAWAHEPPSPANPAPDASGVLAVLVAHNGEQWLPRSLVALARSSVRPGLIIAVDAGSSDDSPALLAKAADEGILDQVIHTDERSGFGASVSKAIQQAAAERPGWTPDWLWLLHDDLEPHREALTRLLQAAEEPEESLTGRPRMPDLLVPKLLRPKRRNHRDQMSALGESIAPSGARVSSVEPGDIDQHQLDAGPVLGGSTAGMLVRYPLWQELGGLDPAIPLFRDGVDFGWRANLAGHLVRSCPQAAFHHQQAGRIGLRESALAPNPQITDEVAGMRLATAHSSTPRATAVRIGLGTLGSAVGYLIGKSPGQAADQVRALMQFSKSGEQTRQLTDRVHASPGFGQELVPGLVPRPGWGVRRFLDRFVGGAIDRYRELTSTDPESGSMIDELTGSDYAGTSRRERLLSPLSLTVVLLVLGSVLAARGLFGSGALRAVRLLGAPGQLGQAWQAWLVPAPGLSGANSPWLGMMALGSTLTLGHPGWWISLLLLGAVIAASWSAYNFVHRITGPGWLGLGLSVLWGLLLPLSGATSAGMIDAVALGIVLPLLARSLWAWQRHPIGGAEGWRTPGAYALWTTIVASLSPVLFLACLIAAIVLAVRRRDLRGGLLASLAPPLVLAPWLVRLAHSPGRLLTGVDPTAVSAGPAPDFWQAQLGRGPGVVTPVWVEAAVLVLVGLLGVAGALFGRGSRVGSRVVPGLWLLLGAAALAPLFGVILARRIVHVDGVAVRPNPTSWLLLGCWVALVVAAFGFGRPVHDSRFPLDAGKLRRPAVQRWTALLLSVAVGLAGLWWLAGAGTAGSFAGSTADPGVLHRQPDIVPGYVADIMDSPRQTRTLVVDLSNNQARFQLLSAGHPTWGDGEHDLLFTDPAMAGQVQALAQQIAVGTPSDDLASRLGQLAIAHVLVRDQQPEQAEALAAAPGLYATPADANLTVWSVNAPVSHAQIGQGSGATTGVSDDQVPSSEQPRTLVLADPADDRWRATLAGQALPPAPPNAGRQVFDLPAQGGRLRVWRAADAGAAAWQIVGLVALLVAMAPAAGGRSVAPRRALVSSGGARRGNR